MYRTQSPYDIMIITLVGILELQENKQSTYDIQTKLVPTEEYKGSTRPVCFLKLVVGSNLLEI